MRKQHESAVTPTLVVVDEFAHIERQAKQALRSLSEGRATTGSSALQEIAYRAEDAIRHLGGHGHSANTSRAASRRCA